MRIASRLEREVRMATAVAPVALPHHDVAQLRGITDEWVRAALARDFEALAALWTDDVVLLPPDAPMVLGKQASRAWFEAFPVLTGFIARVEHAEGRSELAWARGTFDFETQDMPGMRFVGKWSATYRRRGDGRWLVSSDTWNLDAPVGGPPAR
jgi:ketosteroid isomerase-like protein